MKRKTFLYKTIAFGTLFLTFLNYAFAEDSKDAKSFSVLTEEATMEFNILSEEDNTVEITSYTWNGDTDGRIDINIPAEVTYDDITYSVESIGIADGCSGAKIESINIPNGVKYVKRLSFYRADFKKINLPSTLLELEESAFGVYGDVWIDGEICDRQNDITNRLIVSNYVETIPARAFKFNNFKNVTIGRSVNTIRYESFGTIENLICCATIPPIFDRVYNSLGMTVVSSYVIKDLAVNTSLLVPPGCKSVYEACEEWCQVASIKEYDYNVNVEFTEGKKGYADKNETFTLTPKITWLNDESSERYRDWTSSDETVAIVNKDGVVTTHKYGKTTITFTIEDERGVPFDCEYNLTVADPAGVSDILDDDTDTAIEVYTLNGLKVGDSTDNLPAGLYIVKSATSAKKLYIK